MAVLPSRALASAAAGIALLAVATSCTDSTAGRRSDRTAPTVKLSKIAAPADSMIGFGLSAKDNLGLLQISVRLTGGVTGAMDTTFRTAVTEVALPFLIPVPRTVAPGTAVTVVATATDGARNASKADTLVLGVGNLPPPNATITSPTPGTPVVVGKSVLIAVSGRSALKVRRLGFTAAGVFAVADSSVFNSPLRDSVAIVDTLAIPASTAPRQLTLIPFVVDSMGQRSTGSAVVLNVQTAGSANTRPAVTIGLTSRIEVTDTVHVEAVDATGITRIGYLVRDLNGAIIAQGDSTSNGNLTSVPRTFTLRLPTTTFPTEVIVQAYAHN